MILFNRADYLRGYIDGALDILGIDPDCVCCASGVTGTVRRLTQHQADTLYGALNQLLPPLVEAEFARLERLAALPHVRGVAEKFETPLPHVIWLSGPAGGRLPA
ncbi:hypothetical protein [Pseudomonas tolaasii]|uniref:hypothetical protein n=1 Tax=Pseudomonas tolaasii TaxID=29442 RepID=UPI0027347514|nr:hypothetical protein [Pseudomonas tolaasii]WLH52296.1 hypothetical protein PSH62_01480 [Pseudomonas tolaasii]